MSLLISVCLLVVAVIHLLPLVGVLGAARLERLYGLAFTDPTLVLLMRHRAVLFGLLGVFLAIAAVHRPWQGPALVAGAVSVISFLLLAAALPERSPAIQTVLRADLIALVALLVAAAARLASR